MKQLSYFILPALFIFSACEQDPLKVDTEEVKVPEFVVKRLDQDLFALSPGNFDKQFEAIKLKYGIVFEHYLNSPLGIGGSLDTVCKRELLKFTSDVDVRGAYNEAQKLYTNVDDIAAELAEMRKRFHFHFPQRALPKQLVTTLTGWNYAVAYMDSTLTLSLDMYLGADSKYYQMLRYPQYQARKMNREHIMSDLARAWVLTEFDKGKPENTLLNHMIFYGKIFYAVEALLPDSPDSVIIGYSAEQMKTCMKYEKQYWGYCAEKNRLYENSLQTIRELTSEGPFTAAISKECPPRIAMWLGWRIVSSYMKKTESSLSDLMKETDAQKILSKSKYRP